MVVDGYWDAWKVGEKRKRRKFKENNVMSSTHFLNRMKAIASVNCFEKKSYPVDSKSSNK